MSYDQSLMLSCAIANCTEEAKQCPRCHQVSYCGAKHQKKDWPKHKRVCRDPTASVLVPTTTAVATEIKAPLPRTRAPCAHPGCGRDATVICPTCQRMCYCCSDHHDTDFPRHSLVCELWCAVYGCKQEIVARHICRCNRVHYCSDDHQLTDWDRHQYVCYTTSAIAGIAAHSWLMWRSIDKGRGLEEKYRLVSSDSLRIAAKICKSKPALAKRHWQTWCDSRTIPTQCWMPSCSEPPVLCQEGCGLSVFCLECSDDGQLIHKLECLILRFVDTLANEGSQSAQEYTSDLLSIKREGLDISSSNQFFDSIIRSYFSSMYRKTLTIKEQQFIWHSNRDRQLIDRLSLDLPQVATVCGLYLSCNGPLQVYYWSFRTREHENLRPFIDGVIARLHPMLRSCNRTLSSLVRVYRWKSLTRVPKTDRRIATAPHSFGDIEYFEYEYEPAFDGPTQHQLMAVKFLRHDNTSYAALQYEMVMSLFAGAIGNMGYTNEVGLVFDGNRIGMTSAVASSSILTSIQVTFGGMSKQERLNNQLTMVQSLAVMIDWLHQHRIYHGDIAPRNLTMDKLGVSSTALPFCAPSLIDFGHARHVPYGTTPAEREHYDRVRKRLEYEDLVGFWDVIRGIISLTDGSLHCDLAPLFDLIKRVMNHADAAISFRSITDLWIPITLRVDWSSGRGVLRCHTRNGCSFLAVQAHQDFVLPKHIFLFDDGNAPGLTAERTTYDAAQFSRKYSSNKDDVIILPTVEYPVSFDELNAALLVGIASKDWDAKPWTNGAPTAPEPWMQLPLPLCVKRGPLLPPAPNDANLWPRPPTVIGAWQKDGTTLLRYAIAESNCLVPRLQLPARTLLKDVKAIDLRTQTLCIELNAAKTGINIVATPSSLILGELQEVKHGEDGARKASHLFLKLWPFMSVDEKWWLNKDITTETNKLIGQLKTQIANASDNIELLQKLHANKAAVEAKRVAEIAAITVPYINIKWPNGGHHLTFNTETCYVYHYNFPERYKVTYPAIATRLSADMARWDIEAKRQWDEAQLNPATAAPAGTERPSIDAAVARDIRRILRGYEPLTHQCGATCSQPQVCMKPNECKAGECECPRSPCRRPVECKNCKCGRPCELYILTAVMFIAEPARNVLGRMMALIALDMIESEAHKPKRGEAAKGNPWTWESVLRVRVYPNDDPNDEHKHAQNYSRNPTYASIGNCLPMAPHQANVFYSPEAREVFPDRLVDCGTRKQEAFYLSQWLPLAMQYRLGEIPTAAQLTDEIYMALFERLVYDMIKARIRFTRSLLRPLQDGSFASSGLSSFAFRY